LTAKKQKSITKKKTSSKKKPHPSSPSSKPVKGTCQICGTKDAKVRCMKCQTPVCNECYFHLISMCKNCVSKPVADKWKKQKPNWEKKLGVEWID